MSPKVKSGIQYAIIFAIGIAFLYFVFNGIDWHKMLDIFKQVQWSWIAIGLAISLFSHWIRAYRATMLYEALGYKISKANSFYAVLISYFMNYIIPRGGELSRCAALYKTDELPVEKGFGTVLIERLIDIIITALIIGAVVLLQFNVIFDYINTNLQLQDTGGGSLKFVLIGIVAALAVLIFVFRKKLMALAIYQKLVKMIEGFVQGFISVKEVKSPILFIILSLGIWACYIGMMYVCLFGLQATSHLTFSQCLTVFALGTIGVVIPAPGAGAGTYHFAVMQGLLLFGVAKEDGIAYATLVHGAQMLLFILVGGISSIIVLFQTRNQSKLNQAKHEHSSNRIR